MVNERIAQLRKLMIKRGLSAYIVTTSDPHQSEYLADYFKTREFISGFTGSAGTVVITLDEAILWTDGRYFIQAAYELANSEVKLYKMNVAGFPTMIEYLNDKIAVGGKIGFDGANVSYSLYRTLLEKLDDQILISNVDFISEIWTDRPQMPNGKAFIHDKKYSGVSPKDRIKEVREYLKKQKADALIISALDEVCYLYSIRGNDVDYNPVVLSYAVVTGKDAFVFIDKNKLDEELLNHFENNGISVKSYDEFYEFLDEIPGKTTVVLNPNSANVKLVNSLGSNINIMKKPSVVTDMKSQKNDVELSNQKNAYIKDGVALVKFFNWVETGTPTGNVTEMVASDKLTQLRAQGDLFVEPSFETIAAYGPNAAMPHYSPSHEKPVTLQSKGLFLVDSGGQYFDGTTDITRTIALGELTEEEKYHYTLTLKSHIALATAVFKKGSTGYYLDAVARQPLFKRRIDFNHGTGHGVGYFLNVHEGPHSISAAYRDVALKPGMTVSDEPGIYIQDSHGIRIENIIAVRELEKNEYGEFYEFEMLSYVPIDTRPVDVKLLSDDEKQWLNQYNKTCYDKLSPFLSGRDLEYLEEQTKEI